jgi:hypothetical protein
VYYGAVQNVKEVNKWLGITVKKQEKKATIIGKLLPSLNKIKGFES